MVAVRFLAFLAALLAAGPSSAEEKPAVVAVPDLDLARYAGTWYEIARFPNKYQKACADSVVVRYALRADGRMDVVNQCFRADGTLSSVRGIARRAGERLPASQLEVRFAPAFLSFLPMVWADYWVIDLPPDYRTAVVGGPDRKYLWVLSRTPAIPDATYQEILARVSRWYDVSRLVPTAHRRVPPEPATQ
jgi:apolipoprotein D and lipocalin family protein